MKTFIQKLNKKVAKINTGVFIFATHQTYTYICILFSNPLQKLKRIFVGTVVLGSVFGMVFSPAVFEVPEAHAAVAYDAFSQDGGAATGNLSWTHTPSGTPRAIVVFVNQSFSQTDQVSSVTYGGVAMSRIERACDASGETNCVYGYFLGSSIPTGAQTVSVTVSGSAWKFGTAISFTGSADTGVLRYDNSVHADATNPSVSLPLSGYTSYVVMGLSSGVDSVTGITPLAGWTSRNETDFGTDVSGVYTYNTVGSTDVTAGWTQVLDDAAMLPVAITELPSSASASETYTTTGSSLYVVPAGVTEITVKSWGGGGGGGGTGNSGTRTGGAGGGAGFVEGTIAVTPGETLNVYVGGAGDYGDGGAASAAGGTGGTNGGGTGGDDYGGGGGGGGYSGIKRSTTPLIIAAGGAGGGGSDTTSSSGGAGGAGGGTTGTNGTTGGGGSDYGDGGTTSSGGIGGNGTGGVNGTNGDSLTGGTGGGGSGTNGYGGGGGGGSGYYGGGGGEEGDTSGRGAGGGGGSSWATSTASATSTTAGSGTSVGNSGDTDYVASAGVGGAGGSGNGVNGSAGNDGLVVVSYVIVPDGVNIAGTLYESDGTTAVTTGKTIVMAVGTTTPGLFTATSDVSGDFTFAISTSTELGSTTPITLFVDDLTIQGTTLTYTDVEVGSSTNLTGVDIYRDTVRVKHPTVDGEINIGDTNFYDYDDNPKILFTVDAGTTYIGSVATSTDFEVAADTTVISPANLYLYGDFAQNGAVDFSGSTLHFMGANSTVTGSVVGTNAFGNVVINPSSGSVTVPAASTNDLTIESGKTLITATSLTVAGDYDSNGTLSNTGTLYMSGTGKTLTAAAATPSLGNVNISGSVEFLSQASTTNLTVQSGGTLTTAELLTVSGNFTQSGSLDFAGSTLFVAGSGSFTGTFTGSNALGNVVVLANRTITISEMNDLTVRSGFTLTKTNLTVAGDLLVQGAINNTGSLNLSGTGKNITTSDPILSSAWNVSGTINLLSAATTTDLNIGNAASLTLAVNLGIEDDFINNGTFTATAGNVIFNNSSGAQSVSGTGNTTFYDVVFDAARYTTYSTSYYSVTKTSGASWTLPSNADSTLTIEAWGQGGQAGYSGGNSGGNGGAGGYAKGTFTITPNTEISTYFNFYGGSGGSSASYGYGGAGGGYANARKATTPFTNYVIAAGGGGGSGGHVAGTGYVGGAGGGTSGAQGTYTGYGAYNCSPGGGGTSSAGGSGGGGGSIAATAGAEGSAGNGGGSSSGGGGGGNGYFGGGGGGSDTGGYTGCAGGGGSSYVYWAGTGKVWTTGGGSAGGTGGNGGSGSYAKIKFTYGVTSPVSNNPLTKTVSADFTANNVTINAYANLVTTGTVTVNGNYTNNGTNSNTTSEIVLAGPAQQTLSGTLSGTSDFNDLTISNTSEDGDTTQSVIFSSKVETAGTLTMLPGTSARFPTGFSNESTFENIDLQGTAGNEVYLRSASGGSYWYIDVPGSQVNVEYVDVKDSYSSSTITAINSTDSGHNVNWDITATVVTGSSTIANHDSGQVSNAFNFQDQTNEALFTFKLTPDSGTATVTDLILNLTGVERVDVNDFSNIRLYQDDDNDAAYDAGDTQVGGAGVMVVNNDETGTITFATDFLITTAKNYVVVADWNAPSNGSYMTINLLTTGAVVVDDGGTQDIFGVVDHVQHSRVKSGGGGPVSSQIGGAPPASPDVGGGDEGGGGDPGEQIGGDPDYKLPTANSGSWTNGANAYDGTDGTYATDNAGTTHSYSDASLGVASGVTIDGVAVKMEVSGTNAAGSINVQLSWDGGTSWTTAKSTAALTTSDVVATLGGPSDKWGRIWAVGDFSNANFKVRLTGVPSSNTVRVDEIQVRVYSSVSGGGGGGGGDI